MEITYDTFGLVSHSMPHHYIIEASTLGLRPGQWPGAINTTMGNGQPLHQVRRLPDGGVRYGQAFGVVYVDVLND